MSSFDEAFGAPQSRVEACLNNCLEGHGIEGLPQPTSRVEAYLYALVEKITELEAAVERYHPFRLWLSSNMETHEDYCSITLLMKDGSIFNMMSADFTGDDDQFNYEHSNGESYWGYMAYNLKDVAKVRIEGAGYVCHAAQNGVEYSDGYIELDVTSDIYLLYAD